MSATAVPKHLNSARDDIYNLLQRGGLHDVQVEIVSLDKCFQPSMFAVGPKHPAAVAYRIAEEEILEYIHSQLADKWRLISCSMWESQKIKPRLQLSSSLILLLWRIGPIW